MTGFEIGVSIFTAFLQSVLCFLFCFKKEKIFCFGKTVYTLSVCEPSDEGEAETLNESYEIEKENGEVQEKGAEKEVLKKAGAKARETVCPYKRYQSILLMIFAVAAFVSSSIFLKLNIDIWFNYVKLSVLTFIVVTAAFVDLKLKKIPNLLVVFGLSARVVIYVLELIFSTEEVLAIFKNDLIGFAAGFGVLLVAALVSRGAVGFGDVKLFAVIGLCSGAICTYTTLLFGLIINTIASLILMAAKKKNRKSAIPFGPSVCVGYLAALFISSF